MAGMLYERAARVEHTCHHQTYLVHVHARQNRTPLLGSPSEQNALIRKPLYKRYFLMRKLSKIVYTAYSREQQMHTARDENVCHTHRAYGM